VRSPTARTVAAGAGPPSRPITSSPARWARSQPALNADQAAAVRSIATSGNGVDTVQALAGTGKTTMMRALADLYGDAGYCVIGAAPTARAARELREVAGVPAETLHALSADLDSTRGFREKTVLLLDEAGMASTRISAAIFEQAERSGVKVIAVGDPGQLTSVQAGGWLAALTRQHAGPELRRVLRQHDPAERDALEALHDGNPETYLDHKADQITIHATEDDALGAVIDQWAEARVAHGAMAVAMIARDNATRDRLNCAARERLKARRDLPGRDVIIGGREWAPGDRIIARRNNRQLNIDNGTLATITSFDRQRRAVLIRTDGGDERAIDASYLANHVEYAYAITGHSSQGATVENAIAVGRPEEFTHEWAYTALSRARHQTTIHLIADHGPAEQDRRGYAPPQPDREPADALDALARAMRRSEAELLAVEHPELNPPSVTTGGGQPHQPIPSPSPTRSAGWASRESTRSWRPQDPASRTSLGR
jgi:ATP-dependent exoDNAse (exonuclease V) alpha subunit